MNKEQAMRQYEKELYELETEEKNLKLAIDKACEFPILCRNLGIEHVSGSYSGLEIAANLNSKLKEVRERIMILKSKS